MSGEKINFELAAPTLRLPIMRRTAPVLVIAMNLVRRIENLAKRKEKAPVVSSQKNKALGEVVEVPTLERVLTKRARWRLQRRIGHSN